MIKSIANIPISESSKALKQKEPPTNYSSETLVPLKDTPSNNIFILPKYLEMGFKEALNEIYVRKGVHYRLMEVGYRLKQYGLGIKVWDGWRPYSLQSEIYNKYLLHLKMMSRDLGEDKLEEMVSKYVSLPSNNERHPSPHLTGGSVDVTLTDIYGSELPMGSNFDEFSDKSRTVYFENTPKRAGEEHSINIRNNRRTLYHIMILSGFTNYEEEWWHYDYGNQWWAAKQNSVAIYGAYEKT